MRSPEDLIKVKVVMSSTLSLDLERIVEDPAWAAIADNLDLNDTEQREQALFTYLRYYIHRQQLFGEQIFMPSTNGPADMQVEQMEDVSNGNGNSNDTSRTHSSSTAG